MAAMLVGERAGPGQSLPASLNAAQRLVRRLKFRAQTRPQSPACTDDIFLVRIWASAHSERCQAWRARGH